MANDTVALKITGANHYDIIGENISIDKDNNVFFMADKLYKINQGTTLTIATIIIKMSNQTLNLKLDSCNNIFIFGGDDFYDVILN